jgi:ABC-type polysaccharide/polyol phosphate transport system ATPase subunit
MTQSKKIAIAFENTSKRYSMFGARFTLRDLTRITKQNDHLDHAGEFYALKQASFEIERGATVGFIGPNGAGKTTTLQLISNIIQPTSGHVHIDGRVSALIHLGAGFHPELTGRENIYINGAILGMKRREIDYRFDKIVAFSGLEQFLDLPVKRYSSGMYARLGFSIAAHSNPDILLVDEVLSVGDAEFQARCLDRMKELRDSNTTIVFVSHYLPSVQAMCERAIYLDHGEVQMDGEARLVIQEYQNRTQLTMNQSRNQVKTNEHSFAVGKVAELGDTVLLDSQGQKCSEIQMGEDLSIRMAFRFYKMTQNPVFSVSIERPDGIVCCCSATNEYMLTGEFMGEGTAQVYFPKLKLVPGVYVVACWIGDSDNIQSLDSTRHTMLKVATDLPVDSRFGVFVPRADWQVQRGA